MLNLLQFGKYPSTNDVACWTSAWMNMVAARVRFVFATKLISKGTAFVYPKSYSIVDVKETMYVLMTTPFAREESVDAIHFISRKTLHVVSIHSCFWVPKKKKKLLKPRMSEPNTVAPANNILICSGF